MMGMAHVQAVGDQFPIPRIYLLHQIGVAFGQGGIDGDGRLDTQLVQHLEDAEHANAVAVVALGIIPIIRIGPRHPRRNGDRRFHIQREPLQLGHHPQGHAGAVGPGDGGAFVQLRPGVAVMIHAMAAFGIFQIVIGQGHLQPSLLAVSAATTLS